MCVLFRKSKNQHTCLYYILQITSVYLQLKQCFWIYRFSETYRKYIKTSAEVKIVRVVWTFVYPGQVWFYQIRIYEVALHGSLVRPRIRIILKTFFTTTFAPTFAPGVVGGGGTESPRPGSRVAQPGTCVGIIVVQRRVANRNANDKLAACFLSSVATPANASFKSQKQCDQDGRGTGMCTQSSINPESQLLTCMVLYISLCSRKLFPNFPVSNINIRLLIKYRK